MCSSSFFFHQQRTILVRIKWSKHTQQQQKKSSLVILNGFRHWNELHFLFLFGQFWSLPGTPLALVVPKWRLDEANLSLSLTRISSPQLASSISDSFYVWHIYIKIWSGLGSSWRVPKKREKEKEEKTLPNTHCDVIYYPVAMIVFVSSNVYASLAHLHCKMFILIRRIIPFHHLLLQSNFIFSVLALSLNDTIFFMFVLIFLFLRYSPQMFPFWIYLSIRFSFFEELRFY